MLEPIKICDPLYDYIYLEPETAGIINHPSFQRLRSLRQLGFADQAFPSGTHNRYTHSLGVYHLAGQAFDSIMAKNKRLCPSKKALLFKKYLQLSALLHDVGHGPLSHSSENLMPSLNQLRLKGYLPEEDRPARHEDYNLKFLLDKEALYQSLKQLLEPEGLAQILHPQFKNGDSDFFKEGGLDFLPLLRQIISSSFDTDRMDYLSRDSLSCGVKYGLIDYVWLLSHFDCHIQDQQVFLAIDSSALYTLESLLLGRQHMGLVVYFHHKSSIYDQMLKNYSKECSWQLPCEILEYSQFTDRQLFEKLQSDPNRWAKRITQKKPYLRLYESLSFDKPVIAKALSKADFSSRAEPVQNYQGFKESKQALKQNQAKGLAKNLAKALGAYQNTAKNTSQEEFLLLSHNLKQEGLDYIQVDSKRDSIKPAKNRQLFRDFPIFLKNKALNKAEPLAENQSLLSLPSRSLQRIYVKPEHFKPAQRLLKSLL